MEGRGGGLKEGRGVEPRSCDAPRPVDEPRHLEHEELEPEVSPEALTLTLTLIPTPTPTPTPTPDPNHNPNPNPNPNQLEPDRKPDPEHDLEPRKLEYAELTPRRRAPPPPDELRSTGSVQTCMLSLRTPCLCAGFGGPACGIVELSQRVCLDV